MIAVRCMAALLLLTLVRTPVFAQGLAESGEEKAINLLADMASAHLDLPTEYSVVMRVGTHGIRHRPDSVGSVRLYASNKKTRRRYEATRKLAEGAGAIHQYWIQHLVNGFERHQRSGRGTGKLLSEVSEKSDEKETKFIYPFKKVYPFHYPMAFSVDHATGRDGFTYGEYLLQKLVFVRAESIKSGLFSTVWRNNKIEVKIVFDDKVNGRPVRLVRYGGLPDADEDAERTVNEVKEIRWEKLRKADGESIYVPVLSRQVVFNSNNQTEVETEVHFRWHDSTKQSVLANPTDADWREPMRALFDEDWALSFSDWTYQQQLNAAKKKRAR